jgi:hypothetical protein
MHHIPTWYRYDASKSGGVDYDKIGHENAGVAQLVEYEPSKLGVAGSIPVSRSRIKGLAEALFRLG